MARVIYKHALEIPQAFWLVKFPGYGSDKQPALWVESRWAKSKDQ